MEEKYKYFAKDVRLNLSHDSYVMLGDEQKNLITCKCNEALKKKPKIQTQLYCVDEWKHRNSHLILW